MSFHSENRKRDDELNMNKEYGSNLRRVQRVEEVFNNSKNIRKITLHSSFRMIYI